MLVLLVIKFTDGTSPIILTSADKNVWTVADSYVASNSAWDT